MVVPPHHEKVAELVREMYAEVSHMVQMKCMCSANGSMVPLARRSLVRGLFGAQYVFMFSCFIF